METAPLKSFATWARTALIREVTARIAAVLAPASSERVEQAKAVAALEKAVVAAGGGDKGRAAVADKVAYTWFNRIIALRFMDANGYTGIGVVSPQAGIEVGQPGILAEAKRGVIDGGVVSPRARTAVAGLLDGTRASSDPQGEAYALLLADYCRHWNRAMPFMFEREGDFTELLIPANLLADDSVLNRSVKVLTEDVCTDVEVIGWLYQFYISERKDEVFAGFKKNKKAGADEIPAATQLFTPHWIVRYLVENSLGRLWMLNRPSSGLANQMDYYIAPVDGETDFLNIAKPEELKVIDPACGSGHMLTYAFDLLYAIYEEEGYGPAEIPGLILTNNLYGTEIDPRAGALAAFALTMKARAKQRTFFNKQVEPNVCVIEPMSFGPEELDFLITKDGDRHAEEAFWNQFAEAKILGTLIQPNSDLTNRLARHLATLDDGGDILSADLLDRANRVVFQAEVLAARYSVVVANPPYMGQKNMGAILGEFTSDNFPEGKTDLFASFIIRSMKLVQPKGQVGIMCPFVWMFISSYRSLRKVILDQGGPTTLVQLEYSGFEGATVPICAFTMQSARLGSLGSYIRLSEFVGPAAQSPAALRIIRSHNDHMHSGIRKETENFYSVDARSLEKIPGMPLSYWMPGKVLERLSQPTLANLFASGGRLKTHDNQRYIRYFWELSQSPVRWRRLANGGIYSPYAGNDNEVVDWSGKAVAFYGSHGGLPGDGFAERSGITWNLITSARTSFRFKAENDLFSSASPSIFPNAEIINLFAYLAYLNSDTVFSILNSLNPTLNTVVGDVLRLPQLPLQAVEHLGELGRAGYRAMAAIRKLEETSPSFTSPSADGGPLRAPGEFAERVLQRAVSVEHGLRTELDDVKGSADRAISEAWAIDRVPKANPKGDMGTLPSDMADLVAKCRDLVSFSVGCMFGRYSLDEPGLILADQGATIEDYLAKVPSPSFMPDADSVIPIVDGDWFEDDIVERFRQFLRAAFGEQHFEENLRFVTESLGVKNLRDYFVKSFYKDHVQRYKKRPIYWLFSSPKGSFNALIYVHRYTPSTVSTVLNEYLREFQAKLKASLEHAERSNNAKEADRLRKVLLELDEYEHDVLYPLASQNLAIDLDDGVKANYPKLGAALKKIPGLEAPE